MASPKSRSVKIGLFVFAGFVLATVAVFLIGDNRRAWDRKVAYHAKFANVAGLRTGASVRMGGLDVGVVTNVGYVSADDPRLDVTLEVAKAEAHRVLVGSKVAISGRGLLGDKMVEILPPDPERERDVLAKIPGWNRPAPEGAVLRAPDDPSDIGAAVSQAQQAVAKVQIAIENVNRATEREGGPKALRTSAVDISRDLRCPYVWPSAPVGTANRGELMQGGRRRRDGVAELPGSGDVVEVRGIAGAGRSLGVEAGRLEDSPRVRGVRDRAEHLQTAATLRTLEHVDLERAPKEGCPVDA
jgi:hypothetical protein